MDGAERNVEGLHVLISYSSRTRKVSFAQQPIKQPPKQEKGKYSFSRQPRWNFTHILTSFFGFQELRGHFPDLLSALPKEGQTQKANLRMWREMRACLVGKPFPRADWVCSRGSLLEVGSVTEITSTNPFPSSALEKGPRVTEPLKFSPKLWPESETHVPQQRSKGLSLSLWVGMKGKWMVWRRLHDSSRVQTQPVPSWVKQWQAEGRPRRTRPWLWGTHGTRGARCQSWGWSSGTKTRGVRNTRMARCRRRQQTQWAESTNRNCSCYVNATR